LQELSKKRDRFLLRSISF